MIKNRFKQSMVVVFATCGWLSAASCCVAQSTPDVLSEGTIINAADAKTHASTVPALHCVGRAGACGGGDGKDKTVRVGKDVGGDGNKAATTSQCNLGGGCGGGGGGGLPEDLCEPGSPSMVPDPNCCGAYFLCPVDGYDPGNAPEATPGFTVDTGSLVDLSFYNYVHWGTDLPRIATSMLELTRYHRSRDTFVAGMFGQGVVGTYDVRLKIDYPTSGSAASSNYEYLYYSGGGGISQGDVNGLSWASIAAPQSAYPINFSFHDPNTSSGGTLQTNELLPQERRRAEKMEILDASMLPINGVVGSQNGNYGSGYGEGSTPWPTFPGAKYAKLTNWDGSWLLFELVVAESYSNWDVSLHAPPDGRLVEAKNANGSGYTISYKTWTAAEITASPPRQWQIDTVTDTQSNTLSFTYDTVQHGGNWVVTKATLPNTDEILYRYAGGFLEEVEYPDGAISTFSYSAVTGGMVDMHIDDYGAEPGKRHKIATVSGSTATVSGTVVPSTVGMVRIVQNGEGEVSFFNLVDFNSSNTNLDYGVFYRGGGRLVAEIDGGNGIVPDRHFADGWTLDLRNAGYYPVLDSNGDPVLDYYGNPVTEWLPKNGLEGTLENEYTRFTGHMRNMVAGRPDTVTDTQGLQRTHTYDDDNLRNLILTEYSDDTFESYCYNSRNQVTRYRDRNAKVTLTEYNSDGQIRYLKTGLTDSVSNLAAASDPYSSYDRCATDDVQTSEYAVYERQYHASGNGEGKLSKVIDVRGKETDYAYDSSDRLIKVTYPADVSGGTRPDIEYTYDTEGGLKTKTDALGNVVEFFYDSRQRLISTLYDDGTTEKRTYGTTGNSTGLIEKTIDRSGVVTKYEYDDADRLIKMTNAYAKMNGATEVTTADIASVTEYTYLDGTNLITKVTTNGRWTEYAYDYRHRRVRTTAEPRDGQELTTKLTYVDNQLFSSEDAYGRTSYQVYDATDGRLIRTIRGLTPEFSVADSAAAILLTRDTTANADYVISDMVYDAEGNLERTHDGRNIETHFEYDHLYRQTARIAAEGTTVETRTETDYDLAGNALEVRSPRYFDSGDTNGYQKAKQTWTYTDRGLVKTHAEAPGTSIAVSESYEYDLSGRRIKHTDYRGKIWETFFSECCGQVQASENPLGDGTIVRRDSVGRTVHVATIEDYSSHTTALDNPVDAKTYREVTTKYDGRGRPVARTTWLTARGTVDADDPPIAGLGGVSASDGLTQQYLYDDNLADGTGLDATAGVTPLIGSTAIKLGAALTQLADTVANGGAGVTLDATAPGSARVMINAEGEVQFSISDAMGRGVMSGTLDPSDSSLISWNCSVHDGTESISGFGTTLVSQSVNALGHSSKSLSDAAGRTIQSIDALDKITSYEYDATGNRTKSRDPNSVGQDCTFDALGRDLTCTDTSSDATSSTYDDAGNKITSTDAKSEVTTYTFDARGRQIKQTDRLGGETEFAYADTGQLESLTDAEDQVTSYTYNDAGQKLTETYPDHTASTSPGDSGYGIVTFTLDATGRTERKQDQLGDTVTYNYDLAGRMTSRDYRTRVNSPSGTIADTDSFTYDDANRMLTAVSGRYSNTVTYTYDVAGRKSTEALTIGGVTYTTTTGYDDAGQVTKLTYPDGTVVDRTYTDRGQLATIARNTTTVDTRTYDNGGRMLTSTYNNGVAETRAYNTDNTLSSISYTGAAIGNLSYGWDDNKNKTSEGIAGTMSGYGFDVGTTGYDDEDRLVNWERDDTNLDQSWDLSLVGDWDEITEDASTQTRVHGDAHEIISAASQTVTHDAKGNMTVIPAVLRPGSDPLNLTWDFDNRMSSADVDNDSVADVTYEFDALGRRVGRNDGTTASVYIQNSQQAIADYILGTAATSTVYTYIYASYIDEPVVRAGGSGVRYYHRNQQYSITALTDSSGTIKERYAYDAYGGLSVFDGSGASRTGTTEGNRYLYTCREWDSDLAFYHYRARLYCSVLGRFFSRDPIGFGGGISSYRYAASNPLAMVDYNGLAPCGSTITFSVDPATAPVGVPRSDKNLTIVPGFRAKAYTAKCFQSDCECSSCDLTANCCDPNQLDCQIELKFHIYMDKEQIQIERRDPDLIYGHEQAHVRLYVNKFNEYVANVQKNSLSKLGCLNGEDCRVEENKFEGYIRRFYKSVSEIGHDTERGGPGNDSDIDPEGEVPDLGSDPGGCFADSWLSAKEKQQRALGY